MRIKFFCPKCNEWSDEWIKVVTIPTSEHARIVHGNQIHQCWILVDYEIADNDVQLGLTI